MADTPLTSLTEAAYLDRDALLYAVRGGASYKVKQSTLRGSGDVANLFDWSGADPTGNNDNSSILTSALAQSLAVAIPVGIWTINNSTALRLKDYHNIFGLGGITAADGNLSASGGARLRMVGSASSGFVNDDATTPLLHTSFHNLAFYSTGSYTRLFDFTECIGMYMDWVNCYTTQATTLFRSAKIASSNPSWVNHFTNTRWRVPDTSAVYNFDCDFSDSSFASSVFTGGQGIILRGTGACKIEACRIDRAKATGAAGLTVSIETVSGGQHEIVGSQIEENDAYDILIDADQGVDPNTIGTVITGNTFRSSGATSAIYLKRTSGIQLNANVLIGPNIRTVVNFETFVTYDPTYFTNVKVYPQTAYLRDEGYLHLGRANNQSELTIASGSITTFGGRHLVDTESDAASDDLTNIVIPEGAVTVLSPANSSRDVTVKSSGNIVLNGGDMPMQSTADFIVLMGTSTGAQEIARSHVAKTFTPVVTFATPGDLSVAYTDQSGRYTIVGNILKWEMTLSFTPTYTTASGDFIITGLPVAPLLNGAGQQATRLSGVAWGGTDTQISVYVNSSSEIKLWRTLSASAGGPAQPTHIPSGTAYTFWLSGSYQIA
jgi:hypothetical protein